MAILDLFTLEIFLYSVGVFLVFTAFLFNMKQYKNQLQQIQIKGYAVHYGLDAHVGWKRHTALWGFLPSTVSFKLFISDITIGTKLINKTGFFGVKTGNPDFDHRFLVETSNKELAKAIITPEIQDYFLKLPNVLFQIGSFNDVFKLYFGPLDFKKRKIRNLWSVMVYDKIENPEMLRKLYDLYRLIEKSFLLHHFSS